MTTSNPDQVARALPGYEIGAELGRGGFGSVLAGRHRLIGRDVAVKVLLDADARDGSTSGDASGDDLRSRFLSEARVLAGLDHAHVVRIYDYVEHDGLCLLVMEQLTGGSLRARAAAGLDPRAACAIGLAAATALDAAHRLGVLHRDVKPDNLLFTADGVPKVTDFGIAKIVETTAATTTGLIGTPRYMAPEQISGTRLGPSTDLYALGVVLYELLTGRTVFPRGIPVPALLHHHLSVPPQPMPEVPPVLASVVLSMLAKEPAERPPSAHELALRLGSAATAVFGPGWLGSAGIPVRLPDDVLTAAGHQLGATLPGPAIAEARGLAGAGAGGIGAGGIGGGGIGGGGGAGGTGAGTGTGGVGGGAAGPTARLPTGALNTPGWTAPGGSGPPSGPGAGGGYGGYSGNGLGAWNTPTGPAAGGAAPGGPPLTPTGRRRRAGGSPSRRSLAIIASVAAVAVVAVTAGLVLALRGGGGGGADTVAYSGAARTLTGASDLSRIALAKDGTLYITSPGDSDVPGQVLRLSPDGTLSRFAGIDPPPATTSPSPEATGTATTAPSDPPSVAPKDGQDARSLDLIEPVGVAVGPDQSVYVADQGGDRVYRITPDGRASTFAGVGSDNQGFTGDTGLATSAEMDGPTGVAVGPDGGVYITEGTRIRKVTTNGLISTIAGGYSRPGSAGDGGPAKAASLYSPDSLAITADGTIYVSDQSMYTVRKITGDGKISLVAGTPNQSGYSGDNGPGTRALLYSPAGLVADRDGGVLVADSSNDRIRRIGPDGTITTIAGSADSGNSVDGALATEAYLSGPAGLALDPSGALYVTLYYGSALVRIDPAEHIARTVLAPPPE